MTDTPLFDDMFVNTRKLSRTTDPAESHQAAAKVAKIIPSVRLAVLALIREESMLGGTDLNEMYQQRWERRGWPQARLDTPRKRLPQLLTDGLIMVAGNTGTERVFCLTPAGIDLVAS